jgi:hypothetical protein
MTSTHKFNLNFWLENPNKRSLWHAAYLVGMTDIAPLPKTPKEALSKLLVNGHAQYLSDGSTSISNAIVNSDAHGSQIPHDCTSIPSSAFHSHSL